ncbi:hypothetical protein FRC17_007434 [Serendipita sp. 399]|nr:hypothetical protein FRC17_007434 [Serendipita sp. 399]
MYICGTDEYGTATERQAQKEGKTPKELCDHYWKVHKDTYDWFELDFDHFGRTSTPLHTEITQEVFVNLRNNDLLERKETLQLYCEQDQKFLADRFAEGICPYCSYPDARGDQCDGCSRTLDAVELINPRCVDDISHTVVTKTSTHMYLRLDAIQPRTEAWIKQSWKLGKWSPNAVVNAQGEIIDSRLKSGLKPSAITRDLKWGVPVPTGGGEKEEGTEGKVICEQAPVISSRTSPLTPRFQIFDAPLGYPSITANHTPEWKQWWFNPDQVKLFQFMGKDNIYFQFSRDLYGSQHVLFANVPRIAPFSSQFLNYEGGKFSKSRNLGVFGTQAQKTGVPASVWRYYLLANRPESGDSMFSWSDFITANNSVLLKNFGNFVNRILKFAVAKFQSTIPPTTDAPGPLPLSPEDEDYAFLTDVNKLLAQYNAQMDAVRMRDGLQTVMQLSARGNLYLQSAGLNNALLAEKPERCAIVVSRAINLVWLLSAMVSPFMPTVEANICEQLNAPRRCVPDAIRVSSESVQQQEAGEEGVGGYGTQNENSSTVGQGFGIDLLGGYVIGKPDYLFVQIPESKAEEWRREYGSAATTTATAGGAAAAAGTSTGAKGKGKAGKKEKTATPGESEGQGTSSAPQGKTKKEAKKKQKGEVKDGEGTSGEPAEVKKAEAEVRKDTMESTSEIPVPSAASYAQGSVEP